ncbi:uncharacterized protein BP5553_06154 [Venustampulla echinocandica]|uniref:RNB domain-containing protein n=1 Tax=Venustampulla echinocandica TaxID=2656787 RepID=A0A370TMP9_9HELO|nr:uncharacterized protein BP5553_06154 [Venustampulla echinocandica]RDL36802.1 hypothetical protein BP5553_06154 [Venustampulla echinocandica]
MADVTLFKKVASPGNFSYIDRPLANPRKQAIRPFVCWQCLAHIHQASGGSRNARRPVRSGSGPSLPRTRRIWGDISHRPLEDAIARPAAVVPTAADIFSKLRLPEGSDTRDRLKQWEIDHLPSFAPVIHENDSPTTEVISNTVARPPSNNEVEVADEDGGDAIPRFDEDDLVDIGTGRMFLLPGDLVELSFTSTRQPELAIFIRDVGQHGQFYTMTGRWASLRSSVTKFFVPGFVQPNAIDEILPYLPDPSAVSADMVDRLHPFSDALPRNIGKGLLRKMQDFWEEADRAYLKMAPQLENVHKRIADELRPRHASLEAIADMLYGPALLKDDHGNFAKPILYAIHRRLMLSDVGIRVPPKGTLRAGGEYEILPHIEVKEVNRVVDHVRMYIAGKAESAPSITLGPLRGFVVKCRRLIDSGRENRQLTPFGTIGPSSKLEATSHYRTGSKQAPFTEMDNLFIRFIESWSALKSFSNTSQLHSIASAILRAVGRYEGMALDQDTGWTLLQEIGAIPPWGTRAPYELRIPHFGRRLRPNFDSNAQKDFTEDRLAYMRKDWGDLPVFCIDDVGAHEIDDGISIEATGVDGEYWVHVHVADPASHIHPESGVRYYAEDQMQTFYLPDHVQFMIEPEFVASKLSLAPGRPCLTISAKISSSGDILDQKISPGTIHNVVYITPAVLDEVTSGTSGQRTNYEATYSVGSSPSATIPSRPLTQKDELSTAHKETLKILHRLGFARSKILQARGGTFIGNQNQEISVDFNGAPWTPSPATFSLCHYGDPTIKVTKPAPVDLQRSSPVPYLMLLAGEVAARWCYMRGIPSIYRITPRNPAKESPTDFFSNVVLPSRDEGGNIPIEVASEYFNLIGPAQPSTIPGPHVAIGAEMISRCTSPLRRFTDLLVHWQIEAALREEHRLGHSLIGNTKDNFLPFTKEKLDALLPRIDTRERNLKMIENDARKAWFAQFLVRAWHFKEAEIPSPLTVAVRKISESKTFAFGFIDEFLAPVRFDMPNWPDAIQPGDLLEAEIENINTASGQVAVKILRRKGVLESDKEA